MGSRRDFADSGDPLAPGPGIRNDLTEGVRAGQSDDREDTSRLWYVIGGIGRYGRRFWDPWRLKWQEMCKCAAIFWLDRH
jgi:hypothetical protein